MNVRDIGTRISRRTLILVGNVIIDVFEKGTSPGNNKYTEFHIYKNEEEAKHHFDASVDTGLYYESENYEDDYDIVVKPPIKTLRTISDYREFSLEHLYINDAHRSLSNEQIIEAYGILKALNGYYCTECGIMLFEDKDLCWACKNGI